MSDDDLGPKGRAAIAYAAHPGSYTHGCRCESCVTTHKASYEKVRYSEQHKAQLSARRTKYWANPDLYRQRARDQRKRTGKIYYTPEKQKAARLRHRYGISIEIKGYMLVSQGCACAICLIPFENADAAHVDHDHQTGRVRGLLCTHCNRGLGGFQDDPEIMERAIAYVTQ